MESEESNSFVVAADSASDVQDSSRNGDDSLMPDQSSSSEERLDLKTTTEIKNEVLHSTSKPAVPSSFAESKMGEAKNGGSNSHTANGCVPSSGGQTKAEQRRAALNPMSSDSDNEEDNVPWSKRLENVPPKMVATDKASKTSMESALVEIKPEPVPTPEKRKTTAVEVTRKRKVTYSESDAADDDYNDSGEDKDDEYGTSKKKKAKKSPASTSKGHRKGSSTEVKMEVRVKTESIPEGTRVEATKKRTKTEVKEEPGPSTASPTKRKKKVEEEEEVWRWWEEEKKDDGVKWTKLEHRGPLFAPPYVVWPKSVKFLYEGHAMELSERAEEIASFYARMLDHDYTKKEVFNRNFFKDWRKSMSPTEKEKITDLSKCDFSRVHKHYLEESEKRKAMSKEEKQKIKEEKDAEMKEYGYAIVDGHRQKIGNFRIEPPGLFRGRGEHPKMGKLKKRIRPEDVIINCSKGSKVPTPPSGHKWKEVRHDNTVTWLSSWTENVLGSNKYIMLNPSSKIKGEKDYEKFETARKLKAYIGDIRSQYTADFKAHEMRVRQRAVALYFIDKLALRAGNEKDVDEAADTVGCCSLRIEHVKLYEEMNGEKYVVDFDFLGKDSIRYQNNVPVDKAVYKNLKIFMKGREDNDNLFDRLDTTSLNAHLKSLMPGLSAKVFRTYNASNTLQEQLNLLTKGRDSIHEKILSYNRANRLVAVLCNHQRAIPKSHEKSMESLVTKIKQKKAELKQLKKELKEKKGKVEKEKLQKRVDRLKEQVKKMEIQQTDKDENKTIALGTSKLNYLDPRISIAWCKKHDVSVEKIFNKTQREKFRWAIDMTDEDYEF